MKKKLFSLLLVFVIIFVAVGCEKEDNRKVTVQLDYLINTNHTGLYVALEKGYFEEVGIDVTVLESGTSDPLLSLATNKIDFAYSYQEYIMYAKDGNEPLPVKAISAVIQENTSGFIYKKNLGIEDFSDFEGKTYGGWNSPIEENIIEAISNETNTDFSKINMTVLGNEDVFTNLDSGIDFQWVFYGWDMANAISTGVEEQYEFVYLQDYVSDLNFYSPVIAANENVDDDLATDFLSALHKGYEYAIDHSDESAEILHGYAPEYDLDHLKKSQAYLATKYSEGTETFGLMDEMVWTTFGNWLYTTGVITNEPDISKAFTNEYIQ